MKINYIFYLSLLIAGFFFSCSNDNVIEAERVSDNGIFFNSVVGEQSNTEKRREGESFQVWDDGDTIVIQMFDQSADTLVKTLYYSAEDSDEVTRFLPTDGVPHKYPIDGSNVYFRAVSGYKTIADLHSIDAGKVSIQTAGEGVQSAALDLITANSSTTYNLANAGDDIQLQFKHELALLGITVVQNTSNYTVDGVYFEELASFATLDLTSNVESDFNYSPTHLPIHCFDVSDVVGNPLDFNALVLPQTPTKLKFTVTFNDGFGSTHDVSYEMPYTTPLKASYRYQVNISIGANAIENVTVDVEPWEVTDYGNQGVNPYPETGA